MTCRHCGMEVRVGGRLTRYFYHPHNNSTHCYADLADDELNDKEVALVADPAE